jgi:hypothetical protein
MGTDFRPNDLSTEGEKERERDMEKERDGQGQGIAEREVQGEERRAVRKRVDKEGAIQVRPATV